MEICDSATAISVLASSGSMTVSEAPLMCKCDKTNWDLKCCFHFPPTCIINL